MTTGHIVRILRAFKNLAQPQLSHRARLSQFTTSAIETGRPELGLPSRRWYGSFRPGRDEDFVMPDGRCRWDYFSGRVGSDGWWDRRRLPGSGILVFPGRRVGRSVYYECR